MRFIIIVNDDELFEDEAGDISPDESAQVLQSALEDAGFSSVAVIVED